MAEISQVTREENSHSQVALEELERELSCTNCERLCDNLEQTVNCLDSSCGQPTPLLENGVSDHREASTQDALSSHSVCPAKCYATGSGSHVAVVGETTTVTVHVVDQEGMEYDCPVEVSCELVSSDGSSQGRGEVKRKGQNEYEISYSPQYRGCHQFHVQVDGKDISRSPFTVAVISTTPTSIIKGVKGPSGVVVNKKGQIIVVEGSGHCISLFNTNGEKIRSFGSYGSACGELSFPHGVDVTATGDIVVCEFMSKRFQQISMEGKPLKCVGTKHDGSIQVCDLVSKRNQRSTEARKKCCASRRRRASLPFSGPKDIAVHPHSHNVYITDYNSHRVDILTADYEFFSCFGAKGTGDGQFDNPYGITFDSSANVFVADHCNHRVQVFTDSGVYIQQFGSGGNGEGELNGPCGLAIDSRDIVYISERYNHRISLFTHDGQFLRSFGTHGNGPGQFNFPCGIALDKEECIYVCDFNNGRVQVF